MRTKIVLLFFAAAFVLLAAAVPAENLIVNSEFDAADGLSGWQTDIGSWQLGYDAGTCSGSYSALGTSAVLGIGSQYLRMRQADCLAVDPNATPALYLGATYRTTANVWARLYLQFYSDGDCLSHLGFSDFVFGGTSASFNRIVDLIAIPATAAGMRFWVDFNPKNADEPQFTAEVDRIYLGERAEIFDDGLEAEGGSVCRWSASEGLVY